MTADRDKRIVVAEDSRTQAVRLQHVLSRGGWEVELASDGEAALAACLEGEPPAAVISDVLMPKMDGFELCRRVTLDRRLSDVPVILLTSLGEPSHVARGLAAGAANFVAKPYDDDELLARVGRTVEHARAPGFPMAVLGQQIAGAPRPERALDVLASALEDASRRTQDVERARQAIAAAEAENRRLYEEALRANKAKDEFLAVMSHEVRTPLNAITGWAALLLDGKLDAERSRHALETIARSARTQARLIDDILDVSRIVAGKLALEKRRVSFTSIVTTATSAFEPAATPRGIRIETHVEPAVSVDGDADRLAQIITNLVGNAIKFTADGGKITVSLTERERVELVVTDNGEGIDPALLPFIFERFRQGDTSMARRHAGLGLGLAIVRHLVELHGGTIEAMSEGKGRGSTFRVVLPRTADTPAVDSRPAPAPSNPKLNESTLEGLRVLAVEDDPDSAEMLGVVLTRTGAEQRVVHSAAAAIEALRSFSPDVLVSDIGLPEEDGHALIRRIRQDPAFAHLPAVALTAFAGRQSELDARAAGFDTHVAKPASPAAIVAAVRRALALRAPA